MKRSMRASERYSLTSQRSANDNDLELHLLSTPGPRCESGPNVEVIYGICASILQGAAHPQIIYLPDADSENRFGRFTEKHFSTLGEVIVACADEVPLAELQERLSNDALFYIPGGDTFRLAHELHESGYLGFIRKHVASGSPYIGFSAGAVIAGATIQTSNTENQAYMTVETLRVFPFGVNAHFPIGPDERSERVARLKLVSRRENTGILAIEDDAYLIFNGRKVVAEQPGIWMIDGRDGNERVEPIVSLKVG